MKFLLGVEHHMSRDHKRNVRWSVVDCDTAPDFENRAEWERGSKCETCGDMDYYVYSIERDSDNEIFISPVSWIHTSDIVPVTDLTLVQINTAIAKWENR